MNTTTQMKKLTPDDEPTVGPEPSGSRPRVTGLRAERPRIGPQGEDPPREGGGPAQFRFDVAILGLGYVGLPTALAFDAAECDVLGIDVSPARLEAIRARQVDLVGSDGERLETALSGQRLELTDDLRRVDEAALIVICVPTPVDDHLIPDLTALRRACKTAVRHARAGQILVLTSTTYVGCTGDLLVRPLAERGLRVGEDVFVAFSPERIDPGNTRHPHESVPRVVGGVTTRCTALAAQALARCIHLVHAVTSPEVAEMSKLLENTFRAVNIALANEVAAICAGLGLGVMEVIDAAATKPYGFMPFYPGPGVGGHCIPCDPHYLLWQLRAKRLHAPVIEQAMREIAGRPRQVVDRAREILAQRGRSLAGARVLVVGVTYKPDVEDVRESPALQIMQELVEAGAQVTFVDPLIHEVRLLGGRHLHRLEDPGPGSADLVILHTAHSGIDLCRVIGGAPVLDTTYRLGSVPHAISL